MAIIASSLEDTRMLDYSSLPKRQFFSKYFSFAVVRYWVTAIFSEGSDIKAIFFVNVWIC